MKWTHRYAVKDTDALRPAIADAFEGERVEVARFFLDELRAGQFVLTDVRRALVSIATSGVFVKERQANPKADRLLAARNPSALRSAIMRASRTDLRPQGLRLPDSLLPDSYVPALTFVASTAVVRPVSDDCALASAALTNPRNIGCGRSGRLWNSGCAWVAMK